MVEDVKWETKCWGRTRPLVESSHYSKHELEIVEGGFCSFHYHHFRTNVFKVVEGRVRILFAHGWRLSYLELEAGDTFDIETHVPHQFQVLDSGKMIEEYYSESGMKVLADDIVRLTKGSKIDRWDLRTIIGIRLYNGSVREGMEV